MHVARCACIIIPMANAPHTGNAPLAGSVTWDDFVRLEDDDRRELIDGVLVEVEVPTEIHEYIVMLLAYYLVGWAKPRNAGHGLASGYKVKISERRGVMPDVQFFRRGSKAERKSVGLESGHPDLAVEIISTSSVRYDRMTKLNWYASIGVPEYWIIDPFAKTLERLLLQSSRQYLLAEVVGEDAVFKPDTFAGLEIPLAELWTIPGDEDQSEKD